MKSITYSTLFALIYAAVLSSSPTNAAVIASEDFASYTPGVILTGGTFDGTTGSETPETVPGGTGWDNSDGGWDSSNDPNNDGSLTRGARALVQRTVTDSASGIDGQSMILEGGRDATNMATRRFPAQTGDFYIGMDVKTDDNWGDSFFHFYANNDRANTFREGMGWGLGRDATPGPGSYFLRTEEATESSTTELDPSAVQRVVLKLSKSGSTSNYDQLSLWVDTFAVPVAQQSLEFLPGGAGDTMSVLHFRMNNEPGLGDTIMLDNIIVATTLREAAAVPEPATGLIMALAVVGTGFLSVRSRHRPR
ncbi:hypothetical protein [Aeoliella sp.]|uniref:hypothetical protein n=1 Tax=Aeoliella sp. TaxID=2795800 RepID=UPI003CCC0DAD